MKLYLFITVHYIMGLGATFPLPGFLVQEEIVVEDRKSRGHGNRAAEEELLK